MIDPDRYSMFCGFCGKEVLKTEMIGDKCVKCDTMCINAYEDGIRAIKSIIAGQHLQVIFGDCADEII